MRLRSRLPLIAIAAAALAPSCGGDDLSGQQQALADWLVSPYWTSQGVYFEKDCVEDRIGEMSDEDARLVVQNPGAEEAPEGMSAEGVAVLDSLESCIGEPPEGTDS